jgi:hypothetical protein
MVEKLYEVKLMDQLPRIGSGTRIVRATEGRKWVKVTDNNPHEELRGKHRIAKKTWDKITKKELANG